MISTNYTIHDDENHCIIIHDGTGIRVHVFSLEAETFTPKKGELHIFGDDHGEWLAFETEGWNGEELDSIIQAVVWYARYLDYPQMQITEYDPRPVNKLRILKDDDL